jgi:prevent-host-death family protein
MIRSVPVSELRERLGPIIEEVEAGAEVEITRHQKVVAVLVQPAVLQDLRESRADGFEALHGAFLRSVDMQRGAVELELFLSMRERPALPGSRR